MLKSTTPTVITCLFFCGPAAVLAGDDCPKGTDCDLVYSCHPGLHGVLEGGLRLVPSVAPSPLAGGVEGVETILLNGDPSNRVDLVFANDAEVCSMFETDDFDVAARQIADMVEVAALTRSAEGSVVLANGERFDVPATPVDRVVDATGAGDLFASGFIYGLSVGVSVERCAELGSIAAGEVITHMGPRPRVRLSTRI